MERVQFPIRLCFGITANRSQGQTYKRIGINLSNAEMFAHGQLYVALSRVGTSKAVSIFKPKGHLFRTQMGFEFEYKDVLLTKTSAHK